MSSVTIFLNADVRTMDARDTRARAIAFDAGGILAVGDHAEVVAAAGAGARAADLGGASVLPGFIDAHHHAALGALYGGRARLCPPAVTDIPTLLSALADVAKRTPEGAWVVATEYNELLLREKRVPTREEVDAAVPNHPLFAMHYSCHRAIANTRALELAKIDRSTPDPSGGRIVRSRSGVPTGLLIERAMSPVERRARAAIRHDEQDGFCERLGLHYAKLVELGITRVADAAVPVDLIPIYQEAARRGHVLAPTVLMPVSTEGWLEPPWDVLDGPVTGEEEMGGLLAIGPVKLVFDSAPVCSMCLQVWQAIASSASTLAACVAQASLDPARTALAMQVRYGDGAFRTGIRMYAPDEAARIVRAALERGFRVASHAEGNDALNVALGAYRTSGQLLHRSGTPRIEHGLFVDPPAFSVLADSGAAVVTQPGFLLLKELALAPRVPGLPVMPLRSLLDRKIPVVGSSDYPVTEADPLIGIRAAVSRRTANGTIRDPEEQIGLFEALSMYTRVAAETLGSGRVCGTLERGKRADIVVFDRKVDEESLGDARVARTIVGGVTRFERTEARTEMRYAREP